MIKKTTEDLFKKKMPEVEIKNKALDMIPIVKTVSIQSTAFPDGSLVKYPNNDGYSSRQKADK